LWITSWRQSSMFWDASEFEPRKISGKKRQSRIR
jgi:hypothetical protein